MSTLFFDLDGTLTDPKDGIVRCIQYALTELGEDVPVVDELLWCIGPSLWDSFEHLLKSPDRVDQAIALYRERFTEVGMFENTVYDGIPNLLETLQGQGCRLFLATSKPHVYAVRILEHFHLSGFFEHVFGAELDGTRADKSDLLAYALNAAHVYADDALMIGDRKHDMIGARANAMRAVGVAYGYGSREELEAAQALHIVETPQALLDVLSAY